MQARQVRDVMTPNPYCLQATDTIQHAAQEMKQHNIGALPVCTDGRLDGIITDRDIVIGCVAAGASPDHSIVSEYMTAHPMCISPDASVEEALQLMAREQVRRLCVTEDGQVNGILSIGDLAARTVTAPTIAQTLAEISRPVRSTQAVLGA